MAQRRVLSVFLALLMVSVALAAKCGGGGDLASDDKLRVGITKKVKEEDCARKTKKGDTLKMHYTGKLYKDCSKFDSSLDRGDPFTFKLGAGQVIKGWDQGLVGMCVGEKRKLTIPSNLGYGDRGAGAKIPPGATLQFDVELLDILNPNTEL